MRISLCIPVYNEEEILPSTLRTVSDYMRAYGDDCEIVYINDGSTDATGAIIEEYAQTNDARVRLLSYTPNRGKGCAVRTGMLAATGDVVIFTDCDLAYGCDVIGAFLTEMETKKDIDVLIGSRTLHPNGYAGYTALRRIASKTYIKLLCLVGGLTLSDSQTGIKAFRREAAHKIFRYAEIDRFAFDFEAILLAKKCGYKIGEYPVEIIHHRASKVNVWRDAPKMMRDLLRMKKRIRHLEIKEETK